MRWLESKIRSFFVEIITHRKLSNESFKMDTMITKLRTETKWSSPTRPLLRQRIALQFTWKKRSCKLSSASNPGQCLERLRSLRLSWNAEFMSNICNCGLLPIIGSSFNVMKTARRQWPKTHTEISSQPEKKSWNWWNSLIVNVSWSCIHRKHQTAT